MASDLFADAHVVREARSEATVLDGDAHRQQAGGTEVGEVVGGKLASRSWRTARSGDLGPEGADPGDEVVTGVYRHPGMMLSSAT